MRLQVRLTALLVAIASFGVLPTVASAHRPSGAASYSDDAGAAGGASYDENDPYWDEEASGGAGEYGDYGDPYDPADSGGQQPGDPVPPAKPAKPAKPSTPATPAPPSTPAPDVKLPAKPAKYIAGVTAQMQTNGLAAIPRGAPKQVRQMIAAGNRLIGKPYLWGGGHAKIEDKGYDCSGTVSYALIGGGLLTSPMVSGGLAKWGSAGAGRWVTVYANKNHVYMEVAGVRLDTSPIGDFSLNKGPRWRPLIGARKGFKVRHPTGL